MDSKIYIQCVKKIILEITESLGSDYIIYMDKWLKTHFNRVFKIL